MKKIFTFSRFWVIPQILLLAFLLIAAMAQTPVANAATTASASDGPGTGIQPGQLLTGGKSTLHQSATWLQAKAAHRVHPGVIASGIVPDSTVGSQYQLASYPADSVSEPPIGNYDSGDNKFYDEYMWNLCGAGATTVALGYWGYNLSTGENVIGYADPYTTTHWGDSDPYYPGSPAEPGTEYESYVEYISTVIEPPSFKTPGETTWQSYPSAYAAFSDVRDVLNWQASGHSSNWSGYYYGAYGASSLSKSQFESDISADIYNDHRPVIVSTKDGGILPDWPKSAATSHYVTVIGFNFNTGTFTYAETCGNYSCQTSGTGIYTVSMDTLYSGIENDNGNGGLIW